MKISPAIIRHPLQHFDVMMLEWAYSRHLFVHVLLTKADKLNRGPASKVLLDVQQQLKKMKLTFSIQLFSSLNKLGLEELASVMAGRLNYTLDKTLGFDLDNIPEATEADMEEPDAIGNDEGSIVSTEDSTSPPSTN